jgi:hypothetical protein
MAVTLAYTRDDKRLEVIKIDTTIQQTHSSEVAITEHPVETGANITDSVHEKPDTITLECVVTDYPLKSSGLPVEAGRASGMWAELKRLQKVGKIFQIRTTLEFYDDMLIRSLSAPVTAKEKGAVRFSLVASKLRFADTETTAIKLTKLTKAQGKKDGGKQTGTEATEAEERKSILYRLVEQINAYQKAPPK